MSVSIKPLEDRIVIKQVEAEQVTSSGLVIPDTAWVRPGAFVVLAEDERGTAGCRGHRGPRRVMTVLGFVS